MADLGIDAQWKGSLKIFTRHKCASLVIRLATLHYKDDGLPKPKMICDCLAFAPRVPLTGSLGKGEKGTDSTVSGNTKFHAVPIELAGRLFQLSPRFPIWLMSFERGITQKNLFGDEMVAILEIDN